MSSAADVPLLIVSENASSERRITPSWTISQLKARLEPITGVPAGHQRLSLRLASQPTQLIEAANEDSAHIGAWPLQPYAELQVLDTRPPGARANYTDLSSVPKYSMPAAEYERRTDSVLAWKKSQRLGRFDPSAPDLEQQRVNASFREVEERRVTAGARCRLLPDSDHRRGVVRFVGEVPEIPGVGAWVGVALDEPTGRNDGTVPGGKEEGGDGEGEGEAKGRKRYFECAAGHGVFVRAERVEVGDFPVLDEFADEDEGDEF